MKQSRSWGRRKMDKGVWIIATLAVSALALTYTQSCNDEGPTEPSLIHTQSLPASASESPAETTPTPAPEGTNPGPISMSPNGKNTCSAILKNSATGDVRYVKVKYTEPGTEKVQYIPEQTFTVPAGGTFTTPSAQQLFEEKELTFDPDCLWEQEVQCDFTAGQGEHIGHLGEIVILEDPECDECVEWKKPKVETVCGEWNECHEHPGEGCFQEMLCVETKTWNCKEPEIREFERSQPCECECVENGPYESGIIWSGQILKGPCPEEFLTSCEEKCHELGTQEVTWDCQDPTIVPHCRPAPCDEPECILPPEGMVLSWTGPGDPFSECAAFGPPFYVPGPPTDFYLCKSGNDREVMYSYPTGAACSNGKAISHVTECACPPQ